MAFDHSCRLALFGLALAVAFWPGTFDPAGAPRWIVIGVGVPLLLWGRSVPITPALKWGAAFLAWAALSMFWTFGPLEGWDQLAKLLMLAGVFALGSTLEDAGPIYQGLGIGFAVSSMLAIAQFLGWHPIDEKDHTPAGLFMLGWVLATGAVPVFIACGVTYANGGVLRGRVYSDAARLVGSANSAGVSARTRCCFRWHGRGSISRALICAAVAPAALLPVNRTALMALGIAGVAYACRIFGAYRLRFVAAVGALALLLGCGTAVAPHVVDLHNDSLGQRLAIWQDTADGLSVTGHGLGAFHAKFAAYSNRWSVNEVRPTHAHNDPLEMAFDLGIVGFVLFATLVVSCCRAPFATEHLVLLAILVESLTIFVFYQPLTAFLVALCLGRLAGGRYRLRVNAGGFTGAVAPRSA